MSLECALPARSGRHPLERRDDLVAPVRFSKEYASRRHLVPLHVVQARGEDDFDRRPSILDGGGQLDAVHGAGNVDVGEDDPDIVANSRMRTAWSALPASMASKPAASTMSTAFMRTSGSSSTTSTMTLRCDFIPSTRDPLKI